MKKINYKKLFDVNNKNVVIVGGLGLIGREIVQAFSSLGSKVYILDHNSKYYEKNKRKFKNINFEYFDLKNKNNIKKNFNNILKKIKKLDIFVNLSYARTEDWSTNNFEKPHMMV